YTVLLHQPRSACRPHPPLANTHPPPGTRRHHLSPDRLPPGTGTPGGRPRHHPPRNPTGLARSPGVLLRPNTAHRPNHRPSSHLPLRRREAQGRTSRPHLPRPPTRTNLPPRLAQSLLPEPDPA